MQLACLLAVARAEVRSIRRLARYWVFCALAVLVACLLYGLRAHIHGHFSYFAATFGLLAPRHMLPETGFFMLVLFLAGFVFLAFDVRGRDVRERMAEVLDVKPPSNAEMLVGRGAALVFMAWLPIMLTVSSLSGLGLLAPLVGWPRGGESFEPYSLVNFAIHCLTVFAFWCALIILVASVIHHRLVVAAVAFVLLGTQFWAAVQMPVYLQSVIGLTPLSKPSDIVPSLLLVDGMVMLIAAWLLVAGFIALAVVLHPRRDDAAKGRMLGIGGALVVLAVAIIGWHAGGLVGDVSQREAWRTVHEARAGEARADLISVRGALRIDPGDDVTLDVELNLANPEPTMLKGLLLTLNPGLAIKTLTVDGRDAEWTFENGLIDIGVDLPEGETLVVAIEAEGAPDLRFGYLDAAVNVETVPAMHSNAAVLGTDNGIFSSRFVALMPGTHWLPRPGVGVSDDGASNARARARRSDFFTIDLEVTVPEDWFVAGPGRRKMVGNEPGDGIRHRFHPMHPVPEVGLIAGRFERYAMEVRGVEFELLMHPEHRRNIDLLAETGEEIAVRLTELLSDAQALGIAYPYNGFSLVEVPNTLRGYGGGWCMDTVLALPGMMLLREAGFPTVRFDSQFTNPARFDNAEGGIERAKLRVVERFFHGDITGGNVFAGALRNLFAFQTGARGRGAVAVDFVLNELVNRLLTRRSSFFSIYDVDAGEVLNQTVRDFVRELARGKFAIRASSSYGRMGPSVWERALGEPLLDFAGREDPQQAIHVLMLKGGAIAHSIIDGVGRDKAAALLAELLSHHRGGHFTVRQFEQAAIRVGADLRPILGDWLEDAGLPGFIASEVTAMRLTDDERGLPRYQMRLHVRNDEATPGLMYISYATRRPGDGESVWHHTDPERIGGKTSVEFGLLSSSPPRWMYLRPYLSLNRRYVGLSLPPINAEQRVEAEPFVGVRSSDWLPRDAMGSDIVVDDLDPGFSILDDEPIKRPGETFLFQSGPPLEMDQGLPVYSFTSGPPPEWSRSSFSPHSWGKYRRTVVWVEAGEGARRAIFEASIPASGRWQLAYHVPTRFVSFSGRRLLPGTQNMQLLAGDDSHELEFDVRAAAVGWNILGDFRLEPGPVRLVVSDVSSGDFILADAIRWRPL